MNEIEIVESYTKFLLEHQVKIMDNGFPLFKKEWFIKESPKVIIPFSKRHYSPYNKSDTSICFFESEERIYPRLDKLFSEIEVLSEYHSVCMMDISVSPFMLDEVQKMNLLINMLYICVLAVNGIKIIPSFRTGNFGTIELLNQSIVDSKYWVVGAVGSQRKKNDSFNNYIFMSKCIILRFEHLLVYGEPNDVTKSNLNVFGINYTVYDDFRKLSYAKKVNYVRRKN